MPSTLVLKLVSDRDNHEVQADLFADATNFVAIKHGWEEDVQLKPSSYLDVECTQTQMKLLNPTAKDAQMGSIVDQSFRRRAKKKEAQGRGNIV
jgi:hypothetical protein